MTAEQRRPDRQDADTYFRQMSETQEDKKTKEVEDSLTELAGIFGTDLEGADRLIEGNARKGPGVGRTKAGKEKHTSGHNVSLALEAEYDGQLGGGTPKRPIIVPKKRP